MPQKIDLLLGADIFYKVLSSGRINLKENLPTLQETVLGWIVGGNLKSSGHYQKICNLAVEEPNLKSSLDISLSRQLEQFWNLEEITSSNNYHTREQKECEIHFSKTTKRGHDGKFIVRLPFKSNVDELGESYQAALKHFLKLERKLDQDPTLKSQYTEFMNEYIALNHMEATTTTNSQLKYHIPHRCVLRPDSSSTKLRVVFNASFPTTTKVSLNDTLMVGPPLQRELYDIIVRFRTHQYVLTADIVKMYRQISVDPEDRKYLGILWRDDKSQPITTYLLSTVTYGTACAPYQAIRCLAALANEHSQSFPIASRVLEEDFYVDDMMSGADSYEELLKLKNQVCTVLSFGRFLLKKWSSNCPQLLNTIPAEDREPTLRIDNSETIKTLGLIWEPAKDEFHFTWRKENMRQTISKRSILSQTAMLFDPLGLLSPFVVQAKLLMQKLWAIKMSWDEAPPIALQEEWLDFRNQLSLVSTIQIPRSIYPPSPVCSELHGFADASMQAYGCCIYVCCLTSSGERTIRLISSKSRVAPLKTQSLPRLELCAAVLLSKLADKVKRLLNKVDRIILWTDSEIVLHWIKGEPSSWTIFVANRVSQIQQLTPECDWRHVPSKSNPADLVSRGCNIPDLISSNWFTGPNFLKLSENSWPPQTQLELKTNAPERKKKSVLVVNVDEPDMISTHTYINNYAKLCRIFAYVLRFVQIIRMQLKEKGIIINSTLSSFSTSTIDVTSTEIGEAEHRIFYYVQNKTFYKEIKSLQRNQAISLKSPLRSLCPFLDNGNPSLLRVGGRLSHANVSYSIKHPILLPRNHPLTISYLTNVHKKFFHAGIQSLVAISRQTVWIIHTKRAATQVVRRCIHCFHYRPVTMQQIMGNLPAQRVQASHPFSSSGVDFCGPIYISSRIRGRPLQKAYVAVFICFATKGCHLEVVSDLSSDAFILALKRFIARRGMCAHLFCDNATNFVGARSKLRELHQSLFSDQGRANITRSCTQHSITFHFIPPRSPHFGGLWESSVKAAKFHLYRVLHKSALSFEELSTLVAQVEAILNSRPLTAVSNDPNDDEALTPGHFLIGRPLVAPPEPDLTSQKSTLLTRWQHVRALQQHFWTRWVKEYIPVLQQRYKWSSTSPDVKVNTLVLVADENQPPQKWIMGRIIATYPGKDGHTRVVDIKTQSGVVRRAITKIAPLPLSSD